MHASSWGKAFRAVNGDEYGPLRPVGDLLPHALPGNAIAEDGCGNYFVEAPSGAVTFWDHETGDATQLAESLSVFLASLVVPAKVTLKPGQVKSVWVDPEFAKELDIEGKTREP